MTCRNVRHWSSPDLREGLRVLTRHADDVGGEQRARK
jgi:hypothetical protein